jgi:hypothetical protein
MEEKSTREKLTRRWSSLKQERTSWMAHWEEISRHLLPQSGRFVVTNRNRGERRHNSIHDSTGTKALRILAAGLMAGMTSPARPWFRLTTSDPELDESEAVKRWLSEVTRLMLMVFAKSNTYRALHSSYEELGAFGTASNIILGDQKSVIHLYPLTVGEYAIATDYRGRVNTLYREFELTVGQMVDEFGLNNCSTAVQRMYQSGNLDAWIPLIHGIEPRRQRDTRKMDSRNMAYSSCYFEQGGDNDKMLRESGFKDFQAVCPRWMATGGDIYGTSPAMEALGDIKQLQHEQLRKAQCIDYQTLPPLQVPTSMKNQEVNTLPGGITYVDSASQTGAISSAFEVNLNMSHLLEDIRDVRERIKGNFYADLFMMLANGNNPAMTATEVAERHEEKLLMIGPVLERLHNEILDPLIEITFSQMLEAGIVPPPPQELQGIELNVEFVSMLAQAQRAIATNSIDRFVSNLGALAQIKPDVLDKFDSDKWADAYADMLGVDPELIVPGDQVALVRQQRAEAAQAEQQAAIAEQQANTAAKLGSVRTDEPNAMTSVMDAFTGYT